MNRLIKILTAIRQFLRALVVTAQEEQMLQAYLNSSMELGAADIELAQLRLEITRLQTRNLEARTFLAAVEQPHRYRPTEPITASEAESWGQFITGPLGRKLDETMINFCAQRAQAALTVPPAELERAAGFARGLRAGWETAKTLSRHATATSGNPEDDTHTAAAGLEQHQP